MRGAGKSSIGKSLTKFDDSINVCDLDDILQEKTRGIKLWVENNGWAAFRNLEKDVYFF